MNQALKRKYKWNESHNFHSENLLLLANAFGTDEEKREAERQAASKRDIDARNYEMPTYISRSINAYYRTHLYPNP
jgi:hypothetical protein